MIEFKVSGMVFFKILTRIGNKYNFELDLENSQLFDYPMHYNTIGFKTDLKEAKRILNFIKVNEDRLINENSSEIFKSTFNDFVENLTTKIGEIENKKE